MEEDVAAAAPDRYEAVLVELPPDPASSSNSPLSTQVVRQCLQWPCIASSDDHIFARIGETKHNSWVDIQEPCHQDPTVDSGDPVAEPSEGLLPASTCKYQQTDVHRLGFLDLLLHRELSIGPARSWRNDTTCAWAIPNLCPAQKRSCHWDPLYRTILYPKIRLTHMTERSFGRGRVFAVCYSSDGQTLLASYENRAIDVMNMQSESLVHLDLCHGEGVNNLCWMSERTFASCSDDGHVALWDTRLLRKPTQMVAMHLPSDEVVFDFEETALSNLYVKDLSYLPVTSLHPPRLVVSTFSPFIYTFDLSGGVATAIGQPGMVLSPGHTYRTAVIPEHLPFGGNILQASIRGHLLAVGAVDWRQPKVRHGPIILERSRRSVQPYRSLTLDPLGCGFVGGRIRNAPFGISPDGVYSSVVYYRLRPHEKDDSIVGSIEPLLFLPQKASDEILQQPAFSPNGCFLAAPQDRRLDILTCGQTAVPFSEYRGPTRHFTQTAVVRLPKCGDLLCCAVSPRDSVTVAVGCTLGHIHFAQPYL